MVASTFFSLLVSVLFFIIASCYIKSAVLVPFAWNPFAPNCTWHQTDVTQIQPDVPAFHHSINRRQHSSVRDSAGQWAMGEPLKGSARISIFRANSMVKFDQRPRQSLFFPFWGGQQLGLVSCGASLTSRDLVHAQLGLDGSCVWVGCALRQRQPQKFWTML